MTGETPGKRTSVPGTTLIKDLNSPFVFSYRVQHATATSSWPNSGRVMAGGVFLTRTTGTLSTSCFREVRACYQNALHERGTLISTDISSAPGAHNVCVYVKYARKKGAFTRRGSVVDILSPLHGGNHTLGSTHQAPSHHRAVAGELQDIRTI